MALKLLLLHFTSHLVRLKSQYTHTHTRRCAEKDREREGETGSESAPINHFLRGSFNYVHLSPAGGSGGRLDWKDNRGKGSVMRGREEEGENKSECDLTASAPACNQV